MPEVFTDALTTEGLIWIALAALVASTVRGFAGFGTALIFIPIAAVFLPPIHVILVLVMMDLFGPIPAVPRAVREADWPNLRRLFIGMVLLLPLGVVLLQFIPETAFRVSVSLLSLVLLVALISGFRYAGSLGPRKTYAIGGVSGFMGGAAGMPGPPVIFTYMASTRNPDVIRATLMLYLLGFDLCFLGVMLFSGLAEPVPLLIGAMLIPVVFIGTVVGSAIFDPAREKLYRAVAYAIIALSALRGLPIWG